MLFSAELVSHLHKDNIAVIPTDTLYGIVCCADSPKAVEKLYQIRGRDESKPCIILISDEEEMKRFGISLTPLEQKMLKKIWPGKVSVVFNCPQKASDILTYLHRRTNTLAFRVPDNAELRTFLKRTGPLLAPSANKEGKPPAQTVKEAKSYFGSRDMMFIDGGHLESLPSTLVQMQNGGWKILRQGAVGLAPSTIMKDSFATSM